MINQVTFIGNLGKDPEIQDFNGNKKVRFSLATNESWKDKAGEWQQKTEWHNIVFWGAAAERIAQKLRKGYQIYMEGKIAYWEKDEKKGTVVVGSYYRILKGEDKGQSPVKQEPVKATTGTPNPKPDDDLPF